MRSSPSCNGCLALLQVYRPRSLSLSPIVPLPPSGSLPLVPPLLPPYSLYPCHPLSPWLSSSPLCFPLGLSPSGSLLPWLPPWFSLLPETPPPVFPWLAFLLSPLLLSLGLPPAFLYLPKVPLFVPRPLLDWYITPVIDPHLPSSQRPPHGPGQPSTPCSPWACPGPGVTPGPSSFPVYPFAPLHRRALIASPKGLSPTPPIIPHLGSLSLHPSSPSASPQCPPCPHPPPPAPAYAHNSLPLLSLSLLFEYPPRPSCGSSPFPLARARSLGYW